MNKNNLVVDREERVISMSRIFDAPRELVWKVCTDPELIPQWWGPKSSQLNTNTFQITATASLNKISG